MVNGPTGTTIREVHAPTGMVLVLPAKVNVKSPVTPGPAASLQIWRRPVGAGVAVGVVSGVLVALGVTIGVGVLVGKPSVLLVKIASVTPVPILTTTFPIARFLLTARLLGRTSIRATTYPAGMTS